MMTHEERSRQRAQNMLLLQVLMLSRMSYPHAVFHESLDREQFGLFSVSFLRGLFTRTKAVQLGIVWFEFTPKEVNGLQLLKMHFTIHDHALSKSGIAEQAKYLFAQGPKDQYGELPYAVEVCIQDYGAFADEAKPKAA